MSNRAKNRNTRHEEEGAPRPKLRFGEFRKGSGWETRRLADLYDFKPTNTFSRDKLNYEAGEVRNIHYGDIHTRFAALFDVTKDTAPFVNASESLEDLQPESYCNEGDLVFADASEDLADVGKSIEIVALHGELVLSGTHTILARPKSSELISGFGGHLFRSDYIRAQIKREAQGTKVFGISAGRLSNVRVCFPSKKAEQRKIVDCLTALDEMIAVQTRKVETLKAHKRGLEQQLFARDGTLPRFRFPEFRGAPAWEERPAGQLFANRTEEGEEGLPIYSVTMADGMVKRSSLERSVDDIAEANGNKKALKNDIVYNMMRMWQGAAGIAVEDCMVSPAYVVLAPQSGVHSQFFGYLLKLPKYLRILASHSQGLTKDRLRLYYKDFARIPLPSPDVTEQKRIANLLLSIDSLIAVEFERLGALKVHKKGLMQQLFPSAHGVEV